MTFCPVVDPARVQGHAKLWGNRQLAGTLGGAQGDVVQPLADRLSGAFGGSDDQRVLGFGEAGSAYLGERGWTEFRPAGSGWHALSISGHRKFPIGVALYDFRGHNKYMTTKATEATATSTASHIYDAIDMSKCEHTATYHCRVAQQLPARCGGCGEVTA